jgi:tetratricopeptide (TPR) repeat protein
LDRAYPTAQSTSPQRARVILEAVRAAVRPGDPELEAAAPDRRLEQGTYEEGVTLLGQQLADGLAFLHSRKVYHLDLKPSNVLLSNDGRPVLLDFNLSADPRNLVSRPGGTLPYTSPEQAEALFAEAIPAPVPDGRADLFSLGVILYELLTGVPPFGCLPPMPLRDAAWMLLERQRAGCKPVRLANPKVGRRLAALVDRCLAFDRGSRPASASAVARELARILAARRRARLLRWGAPWLVACAALLAGGAVALWPPDPMERGRAAFQARNYAEAEHWFGRAVEANSQNARARWSQALSRARLSEKEVAADANVHLLLAFEGFLNTSSKYHEAESLACAAYCLSRLPEHDNAILRYNQAKARGFDDAALYNDRAYSRIAKGDLDAAEADLVEAIARNRELGEAYHNRAFLSLLRWQKHADARAAAGGLADAVTAMAKGLRSSDLYFDAAGLAAAVGETDKALDYLEQAVELGKNPALIDNPYFSQRLKGRPRFERMIALPANNTPRLGNPRLVIPVLSLLD